MTATPATFFGTEMTLLTGNTGGQINTLLSTLTHGKERCFIANFDWAVLKTANGGTALPSGTVLGVARLPLPFTLVGLTLLADTSLGSSTIAFGDSGNGNSAIYAAAATFTATNTPTGVGLIGTLGVPQYSGFDCVSGLATGYQTGGNGGGGYEDITLTVGAASLPNSGKLRIFCRYLVD